MAEKDEQNLAKAVELLSRGGRAGGKLATKADWHHSKDALAGLREFTNVTIPVLSFGSLALMYKGLWIAAIVPAVIVLGITVFFLYSYLYWMKKDPDRLQTESFRLDERKLDLLAEKGLSLRELQISEFDAEMERAEPKQRKLSAKERKQIPAKERKQIVDVPPLLEVPRQRNSDEPED